MAIPLKQQVLESLSQLPDDVDDIDEIMYRLMVLDKVRKGREDVRAGRVTSAEDVEREIDQW